MRPLRARRHANHSAVTRRHSADRPRQRPGAGAKRRPREQLAAAIGLRRRRMNPPQPTPQPRPTGLAVPISEAARLAGVSVRMVRITNRWPAAKRGPLLKVATASTPRPMCTACTSSAAPRPGFHRRNLHLLALWYRLSQPHQCRSCIAQPHRPAYPTASPPCRPCNAPCKPWLLPDDRPTAPQLTIWLWQVSANPNATIHATRRAFDGSSGVPPASNNRASCPRHRCQDGVRTQHATRNGLGSSLVTINVFPYVAPAEQRWCGRC